MTGPTGQLAGETRQLRKIFSRQLQRLRDFSSDGQQNWIPLNNRIRIEPYRFLFQSLTQYVLKY